MISGVVLAAGEGRRFGGTKQIADLGGKPLAQHAIDALSASGEVDEILVVTGHDAGAVERNLKLPLAARFVPNPRYRDGQSTSLAAALHEVGGGSEAAVILMADQPGITTEHIDAMIAAFRTTRKQIVRLRFSDGPGPSLLSREIYAEAGHLHGDAGARLLIASHPEWLEEVAFNGPVPHDIDTPDELGA